MAAYLAKQDTNMGDERRHKLYNYWPSRKPRIKGLIQVYDVMSQKYISSIEAYGRREKDVDDTNSAIPKPRVYPY